MEYLPLNENGLERSRLEAQQRAAGLRQDDVVHYWHDVVTHPITGQDALVVESDWDLEYFTPAEISSLLSEEEAEAADWFLQFEE